MRYLIMLFIVLLIPMPSFAKGECKEERKKFCTEGSKSEKSDGRSALKVRQRWARTKALTMSRVMAPSLKTTRARSNSPAAEIPQRAISLSRYASTRAAGRNEAASLCRAARAVVHRAD